MTNYQTAIQFPEYKSSSFVKEQIAAQQKNYVEVLSSANSNECLEIDLNWFKSDGIRQVVVANSVIATVTTVKDSLDVQLNNKNYPVKIIGDLAISNCSLHAEGELVFANKISSNSLQVSSTKLTILGSVSANGALQIKTFQLNHSGKIFAPTLLDITANTTTIASSAEIAANGTFKILGDDLDNQGQIKSSKVLDCSMHDIKNSGPFALAVSSNIRADNVFVFSNGRLGWFGGGLDDAQRDYPVESTRIMHINGKVVIDEGGEFTLLRATLFT